MKRSAFILMIVAAFAAEAVAQQTVIHFKKLQEALPTAELAGFKRNKPTGSTATAMGMTTSEAGVKYVQAAASETGEEVSIEVKISDTVGVPFAAMAFAAIPQVESESETESGYQKTITVKKKYKASEEVTNDPPSMKLSIPVTNRFMVEIDGFGTKDAALLHKLVENMALDKLEAAAAGK